MQLGQKFTKELAEKSGSQGGDFIRGFKEGDTTIRFLNEMETDTDSWTIYREHFDPVETVSYPCLGDKRTCPGCASSNERERKAVTRFLTNALTEDGYVNLYRIPQSIVNSFVKYSERDGGTIRARDYTVNRSGSGITTEYSVFAEDKAQVDVSAYTDQMINHEEALKKAFTEAWGKSPSEILEMMDRGIYPKKVGGRDLASAGEREKPLPGRTATLTSDPKEDPGPPPFDEDQKVDEDSSGDDVIEYSREELLKLNGLRLRKVYRQAGLEWPEDAATFAHEDLVDYLIDELTN